MKNSIPRNGPLRLSPGGLFFLAPNGSIGSEHRHGIIELKGIGSALVVAEMPETVLIRNGRHEEVYDYHLTIHDNLMTHLKKGRLSKSTIELAPSSIIDGGLSSDAVHLATVGAAPPSSIELVQGRFQKQYQGGSAIIPIHDDEQYSAAATHMIVDIWATKPGFNYPVRLPPQWPRARPALTVDGGSVTGPVDASWAFRDGTPPQMWLYFRHWFAENPDIGPRPFFFSSDGMKLTREEMFKARSHVRNGWYVRGQSGYVAFSAHGYEVYITAAKARELADSISDKERITRNGVSLIPVQLTQAVECGVPASDESDLVKYLRSAADAAESGHPSPDEESQ